MPYHSPIPLTERQIKQGVRKALREARAALVKADDYLSWTRVAPNNSPRVLEALWQVNTCRDLCSVKNWGR